MTHPDETIRYCQEKLKDLDNLSPNQKRELDQKLAASKAKKYYYEAREKVMQDEGFFSWLFF
jgi:hypothetical protein